MPLKEIAKDIWTVDGGNVPFYGLPYSTRMTIIRLKNDRLWIHSPIKLSDELTKKIDALGTVQFLISPNKIHYLFMEEWRAQYPQALSFSSPGLRKRKPALKFDKDLSDAAEPDWQDEIDQLIFKGSPVMEEVVFFHKSSKTLILADLIENFSPDHFKGFQKLVARATGIISPHGKTPIDWRLTFFMNKRVAKQCLQRIFEWKPEMIIFSHGLCVFDDAENFLRRSFNWLEPVAKANKKREF